MRTTLGFTLIEFLLYIALAAFMIAVLGGIGINVLTSRTKAHAQEEVRYNGQFIFETLQTAVADADAIIIPSPGESSTTLQLQMPDAEADPTTIYAQEDGVYLQRGTNEPIALSGGSVDVSQLLFSNVTQDGGDGSVRVELLLTAYNPENQRSRSASSTLYTTFSIQSP